MKIEEAILYCFATQNRQTSESRIKLACIVSWECARPNAIVTVVALYDQPQGFLCSILLNVYRWKFHKCVILIFLLAEG